MALALRYHLGYLNRFWRSIRGHRRKWPVKYNRKSVLLWVFCEKNIQNTHKKDMFSAKSDGSIFSVERRKKNSRKNGSLLKKAQSFKFHARAERLSWTNSDQHLQIAERFGRSFIDLFIYLKIEWQLTHWEIRAYDKRNTIANSGDIRFMTCFDTIIQNCLSPVETVLWL